MTNPKSSRQDTGAGTAAESPPLPAFILAELGTISIVPGQVRIWLETERTYTVLRGRSLEELAMTCNLCTGPALLVFCLELPSDLPVLANLLQILSKLGKQWSIQVMVFDYLRDPKAQAYLCESGCIVTDPDEITLRGLKHKIDRHLKMLEYGTQDEEPELIARLASTVNSLPTFRISWKEPLLLKSDLWLLPVGRFLYRVEGKWILSLAGPAPQSGKWVKAKSQVEGTASCWQWVPQDTAQSFAPGEGGTWNFRGEKPQFEHNRWIFVGDALELFFRKFDGLVLFRARAITVDNFEVAPNSAFAVYHLPKDARPEKTPATQRVSSPSLTAPSPAVGALQPVGDTTEIQRMLEEAHRRESVIQFWCKGQTEKWQGKFVAPVHASQVSIQIPDASWGAALMTALQQKPGSQMLSNFKVSGGSVFFLSRDVSWNPETQILQAVPEGEFFKAQRRKGIRASIDPANPLLNTVDGASRELIDVSMRGMSAYVELSEVEGYPPGTIVPITLDLFNDRIQCDGEIRWIRKWERGGRVVAAIGILFKEQTPLAASYLQLYIFELLSKNE